MPARAAFHRAGIVCGGDRNPDRGILVLAVLARRQTSDGGGSLRLLAVTGAGMALIFALTLALQGAAGFILIGCER